MSLNVIRSEHAVQRIELENGVRERWEPHMEEYKEAFKIINIGKQQVLKQQMQETARERVFYLTTLAHHAGCAQYIGSVYHFINTGGQKQASRVSKMIQMCTHRIKKLLSQYQELQVLNGESAQATVKDVCSLTSFFWVTEHSYVVRDSSIPASSRRRLVELSNLKERAIEEKQLTIADMLHVMEFYHGHLQQCHETIATYVRRYNEAGDIDLPEPPYPDNFYTTVGSIVKSLGIPVKTAGAIASLMIQSHRLHQHKNKSEWVTKLLVKSYWDTESNIIMKVASARIMPLTHPLSLNNVMQSSNDYESDSSQVSSVVSSNALEDVIKSLDQEDFNIVDDSDSSSFDDIV